jgi:integrase
VKPVLAHASSASPSVTSHSAVLGSNSFGDRRLDAVGVSDVAAWQAALPEGYRPKIVAAFSQVLDRAVVWKLLRENPVRLARTGKRRVARRPEIEPFTQEEIDRVAAEVGPVLGPMVVFAAETGLRPGELAALESRDLDRESGVVFVRRVFAGGRVKLLTGGPGGNLGRHYLGRKRGFLPRPSGRRRRVFRPLSRPSTGDPRARPRRKRRRLAGTSEDGAYRDRTGDLRLAKPALSQLS